MFKRTEQAMRVISLLVFMCCSASVVAQPVQQSGTVTQRHAACWTTSGVIQDCGTAAVPFASSLGTVGQGPTICASSAASSGPFNRLCLSTNTSSNAQITLQNFGGATAQGLDFVINGSVLSLPVSPGTTFVTAVPPFTQNDVPSFQNSSGALIDSGLRVVSGAVTVGNWAATPVPVNFGGTGAGTASAARTNLGLGSMALQDAGAVAITGGTIVGLPSPVGASDAATKGYVDATSQGLLVQSPVRLATAAILSNSPAYSNGAAGVGATLISTTNGALSIDGIAVATSDRVLVQNQASAFQNGCYTVTATGSAGATYTLTRCTDFDTAAEMLGGSYFFVTAGNTNISSAFVLSSTVNTVGTTSANFFLFSSVASGVASIQGMTGPLTCGTLMSCTGGVIGSSLNTDGFAISKSVSGSATGRLLVNSVTVPGDNVNVTVNCVGNIVPPCNPSGEGWRYVAPINLDYQVGGANVQGSRIGIMSNMAVTAANNSADTTGGFYNSIFSSVATTTNSNGSIGDPRGYIYAIATQSVVQPAATHWAWVTGQETDIEVQAGASVFGKVGLIINQMGLDRVQGTNVDDALIFTAQSGAPGWSCLICTEGTAGSSQIISPSGTYIKVNTPQSFNIFADVTLATLNKVFNLTAAQQTIAQNDLGFSAWTSYTPTISCGSGTLTSGSATGAYMLINKTLFMRANAVIGTNGTCGTYLSLSAPAALISKASQIATGRTTAGGRQLQALYIQGSAVFLALDYANAYPGADGASVQINGSFEVQ